MLHDVAYPAPDRLARIPAMGIESVIRLYSPYYIPYPENSRNGNRKEINTAAYGIARIYIRIPAMGIERLSALYRTSWSGAWNSRNGNRKGGTCQPPRRGTVRSQNSRNGNRKLRTISIMIPYHVNSRNGNRKWSGACALSVNTCADEFPQWE